MSGDGTGILGGITAKCLIVVVLGLTDSCLDDSVVDLIRLPDLSFMNIEIYRSQGAAKTDPDRRLWRVWRAIVTDLREKGQEEE